jgi:tight adherence protein C
MFVNQDWRSIFTLFFLFLGVCGLLACLSIIFQSDRWQGLARLRKLAPSEKGTERSVGVWGRIRDGLSLAGTFMTPDKDQTRLRLEARLIQAGLYSPGAMRLFLGVKLLLTTVVPVVFALVLFLFGALPLPLALVVGLGTAAAGLIAPGLWLDQRNFRQALPDALDLLVLCLEGGISLAGAVQRVTEDLEMAHPLLAAELNIVQRSMQMGASAGEAIKIFADRCGLEEVRDLASVLLQSERFGAGASKALRTHADGCRQERQQRAEEMAQKAAVKILFPTLLCIFPAIFIVLLGPAAYQMMELFSKTR